MHARIYARTHVIGTVSNHRSPFLYSAFRTKGDERGYVVHGVTREASPPFARKKEPRNHDNDQGMTPLWKASTLAHLSYELAVNITLYVDLCVISGHREEKKNGGMREKETRTSSMTAINRDLPILP